MRFSALRRLARDRRGNVAMYFGLVAIPLLFAIGMGVDYANNARRWSQMNAAADAAALAAVTPQMMMESTTTAQTAATDMFTGQIQGFSGLTFNPSTNLTVTVANSGLTRTATVSYTAQVANVFGGILGSPTMSISGSSTASGSTPPNVNFYLLLDTSPSMAIPATQAGINTMITNTSSPINTKQGGCAFACHEANPSADNLGNPGGEDNYALARNLGLTLRIDEVGAAAAAMVSSAISTESQNTSSYGWTPTYQIAILTFDLSLHPLYSLTSNLSTLQSDLSASPSPIQVMEVYSNNNECANSQCTSGTGNNDTDTNIDAALSGSSGLNTSTSANYIPNPGTGATGSTPAEVLMIVTDGVEDETVSSVTAGTADGSRQQAPIAANSNVPSTASCTAIKNRGIKVAVLYTTYYPLDNGSVGSWYDSYIYQFQPGGISGDQIGPDLENNCASPGLFYEVQVGEDISAALVTLFQMALQSSHLTQ